MFSGGEQALRNLNKIKSNDDDYCPHSMLFIAYVLISIWKQLHPVSIKKKDHKNSNNKSWRSNKKLNDYVRVSANLANDLNYRCHNKDKCHPETINTKCFMSSLLTETIDFENEAIIVKEISSMNVQFESLCLTRFVS